MAYSEVLTALADPHMLNGYSKGWVVIFEGAYRSACGGEFMLVYHGGRGPMAAEESDRHR